MRAKVIGFSRGTSKAGKPFRVAYVVEEIPQQYGFGMRSTSVFLPANAPDPVLNHMYLISFNEKHFCDCFEEVR